MLAKKSPTPNQHKTEQKMGRRKWGDPVYFVCACVCRRKDASKNSEKLTHHTQHWGCTKKKRKITRRKHGGMQAADRERRRRKEEKKKKAQQQKKTEISID